MGRTIVKQKDMARVIQNPTGNKFEVETSIFPLEELLKGNKVTRVEYWELGVRLIYKLQIPDVYSKMTEKYIYVEDIKGDVISRYPHVPSVDNMLKDDWFIVTDEML